MAGVLFIRADAGSKIGSGHFMRMLALGEAWLESGGQVVFGGVAPEGYWRRARRLGARTVAIPEGADDATWTVTQAWNMNARAVVADGYHFPVGFQSTVRGAGLRLLVVDDNGENGAYDADWVLNVNVHAEESMYVCRAADTRLLLGPRYTLIRSEIRRASGQPRQVAPVAHKLLVTMGGSDPPDATGRFIRALCGSRYEANVLVGGANRRLEAYRQVAQPGIALFFDVEDVTPLMNQADLALAAAGGTVWELALLGVPSVVVSLADNQRTLADRLHRIGAVEYLGDVRIAAPLDAWLTRLAEVADDPRLRADLVSSAKALVDGSGVFRVVAALQEN